MSRTPAEGRARAVHAATTILDRTSADPDDDAAIVARAYFREIDRQARTAVPEIDVERLIAAAKGVVAAQYGIHLGLSGSPSPKPEDFTPMVTQASIAELAAALAATAPQEPE